MQPFKFWNKRLPIAAALGRTGRGRNAIRENGRWSQDTRGFPARLPGEYHACDERA
jgi:hypothetical protein